MLHVTVVGALPREARLHVAVAGALPQAARLHVSVTVLYALGCLRGSHQLQRCQRPLRVAVHPRWRLSWEMASSPRRAWQAAAAPPPRSAHHITAT